MKKLLSIMLAVAMVLTTVIIPVSVSAEDAAPFDGDYVAGDYVLASFNASDLAEGDYTTTNGGEMQKVELAGETYVKVNQVGANKPGMTVSSITIPHPAAGETVYVKFRFHAAYDNQWEKTVYFYTSAGKRGDFNLLEHIVDKANNVSANAPGTDVIVAMTTDGFTLYSRMADSDGAWNVCEHATDGLVRPWVSSAGTGFIIYRGLAVSTVKVYKKNPGAAPGAAADYSDGDYVVSTFDADNEADVAQLTASVGPIKTGTYAGEKYVYSNFESTATDRGSELLIPQIQPTFPGAGTTEYVKMRLHATLFDAIEQNGKTIYLWEKAPSKARYGINAGVGLAAGSNITDRSTSAPGVDVIFTISGGKVATYTRTVGDEYWTLGKAAGAGTSESATVDYVYRDGNPGGMQLYYALGINEAVVYRKVDAATSAFNAAAKHNDAAAIEAALSTYASNYGINIAKLDEVENDNAVYAKLFGKNFATAAEVASAFNAAVDAQIGAEFNGDYVEGYKTYGAWDANDPAELAKAYVDADAEGNAGTVATVTYDGDTYAYANGGNEYLKISMRPGLVGETLYIKFRTRAMTDGDSGKTPYFYFANTHRIYANLKESLYKGANSSLSLKTDGPGMDNIYAISSTGAWTLFARQVGSTGGWTKITTGQSTAHYDARCFMIPNGLAINNVKIYVARAPQTAIELSTNNVKLKDYEKGNLIIASFTGNGDKLLDCEVITSGLSSDTPITISDKIDTTGATVIRAFLWENLTTLKPLCDFKFVNLAQ